MSTPRRARISRRLPDYLRPFNPRQRLTVMVLVFVAFVVLIDRGQPVETAIACLIGVGLAGAQIINFLDSGAPHGFRRRAA